MASSRVRTVRGRRGPARGSRPSGRYTAPAEERVRTRGRWQRPLGWLLVVVGLVVAALNGLMYMGDDLTLLPGGFSLAYVLGGFPVAAAGAWFLGAFDEGRTVYR